MILTLQPLTLAESRSAFLARWVTMDPRLVTSLSALCGGDIQLAVDTVTSHINTGEMRWDRFQLIMEGPLRLPGASLAFWSRALEPLLKGREECFSAAAASGWEVDRRGLEAVCGSCDLETVLVEARLASRTSGGFRWASGALVDVLRHRFSQELPTFHAAFAKLNSGTEWGRGVHHLRSGETLKATDILLPLVAGRASEGHMVETEVVLRELERELKAEGLPEKDPRWADLYHAFATLGPTHLGNEAAEAFGVKALELGEALVDPDLRERIVAMVSNRLGWLCCIRGLPRRGRGYVERAIAIDPSTVGAAQNLGLILISEGWSAAAQRAFETAGERALAKGDVYSRCTSLALAAIAKRYQGEYEVAIEELRFYRRCMNREGFHAADADNFCSFGDAQRFLGDLDGALASYREAVRHSMLGQSRADLGFEIGLALCHLERGDAVRSEAMLAGCLARLSDEGPTMEGIVRLHHLSARVALGEEVTGRHLRDVVQYFHQSGYVDPDLPRSVRRMEGAGLDVNRVEQDVCLAWERRLERGKNLHPEQLAALNLGESVVG